MITPKAGTDESGAGFFFFDDILVMSIPIVGRYPSQNEIGADGFRGGRKSKAYRDLFAVVTRISERVVAMGWRKIVEPARVTVTRYATTRAARDAINLGTAELNALTKGGVWLDDALGADVSASVVVSDGPDRVLIVVQRLSEIRPNPRSAAAKPKRATEQTAQQSHSGQVAYMDGRPISMDTALELIRKDSGRGRERR